MAQTRFEGNVDTRWLVELHEDRRMVMLSSFSFFDSAGEEWIAHPGEKIDGASIPEFVWSAVVGTPFIGDYRRASIVHDVACTRRDRDSRAAHRMFYEAMLADGTSESRAKLFYVAVRLFGPRWKAGMDPETPEIDFDQLEAALDQVVMDR